MANPFREIRGDFLRMDLHEFKELYDFFQRMPELVRPAVAQLLNDLAFRGREVAIDTLGKRVIIRNRRFALSRMRVQKTGAKPIAQQQVILGSISSERFSGWAEFQRGGNPQRNRVFSLLARGGQKEKQASASSRLKPGTVFPKPEDWDDIANPRSRVQAMIRVMSESNIYGRVFMLPKGQSGGLTPGLYRVSKGSKSSYRKSKRGGSGVGNWRMTGNRPVPKIQMIQRFGKAPRSKRWPWIQTTVKQLIKTAPLAKMWSAAMDRVMAHAKPK
ncbi:MAG: hypothetical protein IMZ69_01265 [Spirochaetes bacterium]|nr:hypothetical protein [Spirochaetota bacterium]